MSRMSDAAVRKLILGTAGHIDHGKTSLVRTLTGIDTDRLPEEKSRGITIDIGFAHLNLGDVQLGIIDVPGHERFVKNMLAGAVGIDVAMLVIAADDSIMPQTREHLAILQMLDIRHGIIALTKADLVDADWLELIEDDIRTAVQGTFLREAPIVRTATPPGKPAVGYDGLKEALRAVCARVVPEGKSGPFRLPVDRAFTAQGAGTIITGTVWSGEVKPGDEVQWLPAQQPVRVRGIQSHGKEQPGATRGQRAAVNLIGVHHSDIHRGHELATPGYLKPSRLITVELHVLPDSVFPVKNRSRHRLHLGTQEVMVSVSLFEGTVAEAGSTVVAQLFCAEPAVATSGQPFVLRLESPVITIGGGHVLQPAPPRMGRRARRAPDRLTRLALLRCEDAVKRASAAAYFFGVGDWTALDLCRDANLRLDEAHAMIAALRESGELIELPLGPQRHQWVQRDALAEIENGAFAAMKALHEENPASASLPRNTVALRMKRSRDLPLVNAVLDRLIRTGRIGGDEHAVMLTKYAPKLSPAQMKLREQVITAYQAAGEAPPEANDLAKELGATAADMKKIADLCVAQKLLVHLGAGWYLPSVVEAAMRQRAAAALEANPDGITMAQMRDALNTSRKYAIPFGEHLDRIGVTKRRGDLRVMMKK